MTINARRIETMMAEMGLTKRGLSELCGISPQNISTIIRRGTCEPRTAGRLAAGLGVPVSAVRSEGSPSGASPWPRSSKGRYRR